MGTSSIWWWGHRSPEAFTKFQHLKNAAFCPQREFCIGWRSTAPGPSCLPALDHRCSSLHPHHLVTHQRLETWSPVGRCSYPGQQWQRSPAISC